MESEWEDVKKRLSDLSKKGPLDWRKVSKKDLETIIASSHMRERKKWDAPASAEIERRRHKSIMWIVGITLFFTIIGACITAYQLFFNFGK